MPAATCFVPEEHGHASPIHHRSPGLPDEGGPWVAAPAPCCRLALRAGVVSRQLTEPEKMSRLAMTCWPQRHLFKPMAAARPTRRRSACGRSTARSPCTICRSGRRTSSPASTTSTCGRTCRRPGRVGPVHETTIERNGKPFTMRRLGSQCPGVEEVGGEAGASNQSRTRSSCASTSPTTRPSSWPTPTTRAQGGHPRGENVDGLGGHPRPKTMRANTGRRSAASCRSRDPLHRLPEEREDRRVPEEVHRVVRELAEYGEKVGVKITIENHGACAQPDEHPIIMDEVNHPYSECTPDFLQLGETSTTSSTASRR